MEYFIFILFFSIFVQVSILAKEDLTAKILYYFLILFVVFFTGLRGVGDEYTRVFVRVPLLLQFFDEMNIIGIEKGYLFAIICSTLKTIGLGSQSLLFLFALTSITIHAIYYQKFTKYYFLAFSLYLAHEIILHEWIQIRAGLVSALVLPCIYCIVHRRKRNFILLVIISFLIQYVGILSLFLKWLDKRIKSKTIMSTLFFSCIISFSDVIRSGIEYLANIGIIPNFISIYVTWQDYSYDIGMIHGKTVIQILTVIFILYLRKKIPVHPSPYFNIIFNTYYLSTLLFILFSDLAIFATRFGGHFYVVEPILLTYLTHYFSEKKQLAFIILLGVLVLAYTNYCYNEIMTSYEMFVKHVQ